MPATRQLSAEDYQRAEQLIPINRSKLVAAGKVSPRWIGKGERFWYRVDGPSSCHFVLVEPDKGLRAPAFDHQRRAGALETASGVSMNAAALPFGAIELFDGAVEFDALNARWRCALETYACEKVEPYAPLSPLEVKSPDGRWVVFRRGHDLWIRSLADGAERRLTEDGDADNAYGAPPACLSFGVLMSKFGLPHLPPLALWSPDSRRVVAHRTDERNVRLDAFDRGRAVERRSSDPAFLPLRLPRR